MRYIFRGVYQYSFASNHLRIDSIEKWVSFQDDPIEPRKKNSYLVGGFHPSEKY